MWKILLCLFILFFSQEVSSQDVLPCFSTDIKKGTLYYTDGSRMSFSDLCFQNSVVVFTDSAGVLRNVSLEKVENINKRRANATTGIIIGSVSGLVVGAVAGSIAYPDRSFLDWLIDSINNEDNSHTIKKQEIPIIAGCTLAGAGIGLLIGKLSKKEKTVYRRNSNIDVFPKLTATPQCSPVVTVGMHITIPGS